MTKLTLEFNTTLFRHRARDIEVLGEKTGKVHGGVSFDILSKKHRAGDTSIKLSHVAKVADWLWKENSMKVFLSESGEISLSIFTIGAETYQVLCTGDGIFCDKPTINGQVHLLIPFLQLFLRENSELKRRFLLMADSFGVSSFKDSILAFVDEFYYGRTSTKVKVEMNESERIKNIATAAFRSGLINTHVGNLPTKYDDLFVVLDDEEDGLSEMEAELAKDEEPKPKKKTKKSDTDTEHEKRCRWVFDIYQRILALLKSPDFNCEEYANNVTFRSCMGALENMEDGDSPKQAIYHSMIGKIAEKDLDIAKEIWTIVESAPDLDIPKDTEKINFSDIKKGKYILDYEWDDSQKDAIVPLSFLDSYIPDDNFFVAFKKFRNRLNKALKRIKEDGDAIATKEDAINMFFVGKPGTGKTYTLFALAAAFGLPLRSIPMSKGTEEDTFTGLTQVKDGKLEMIQTQYAKNAHHGGISLIEEINLADPDVVMGSIGQYVEFPYMIMENNSSPVYRHPLNIIVGTMNIGTAGSKEVNEALSSRFTTTYILDDPTEEDFISRLMVEC